MKRIKWVETLRNEVLKTAKEDRSLQIILKRETNLLKHILRGDVLLTIIIEGTVERGNTETKQNKYDGRCEK